MLLCQFLLLGLYEFLGHSEGNISVICDKGSKNIEIQEIKGRLISGLKGNWTEYDSLVENINKQEEIVEKKDNLTEQLQTKYSDYSEKEDEMLKHHRKKIGDAFEYNEKRCYEIISKGDGFYFGRKTFIRLFIVFCVCFGIIVAEIVFGLVMLLSL